jgi:hypothetical protein
MSKSVRPPWWLKPANKVFVRMSRLGLSFGGESPVVLTVPGRRNSRHWPAASRSFDWTESNNIV